MLARHTAKGLWEGKIPVFEIRYFLAQVYLEAGQPNKAAEILEKALSRYDEFRANNGIWAAKAHYYLGMAYQELGRLEEAIQKYQVFLDMWKEAEPGIPEIDRVARRNVM